MNISELIRKLESIRDEHGDLRCVTPGFDESNYDDIETVEIMAIRLFSEGPEGGHGGGAHGATDRGIFPGEVVVKAVNLNF